ncbi:transposase [Salinisphaera sp. G21_0]|uniref:IS66 family transposase n=1 Tax=Salinisphaera sp. G21_0 TaxID=2821094 RepID=UPI001ADD4B46|nr:transposase [Salinisphaera sp. G21_0]MBO9483397.1 transposase [Salinisphaera sp. G21_0]
MPFPQYLPVHLHIALTNLEQRAGQLLQPVAHEVLNSCLESHTLALDETPSKAGLKCKGKMEKGYFWCFYGDHEEIAFARNTQRSLMPSAGHTADVILSSKKKRNPKRPKKP